MGGKEGGKQMKYVLFDFKTFKIKNSLQVKLLGLLLGLLCINTMLL